MLPDAMLKLIVCIPVVALAGLLGVAQPQQRARLNVLFLIADDLNNDLGAYGAPVRSPNIDRLAARGVRFDRAYTPVSAVQSRAGRRLLTGRRPNATGVLDQSRQEPDVAALPREAAGCRDAAAAVSQRTAGSWPASASCITTACRSRSAPRAWTTTARGTSRSILADAIGRFTIASFRSSPASSAAR